MQTKIGAFSQQLNKKTYNFYKFSRTDVLMENGERFFLKLKFVGDNEGYGAWFDKQFVKLNDIGLFGTFSFAQEFKLNIYKTNVKSIDWTKPCDSINLFNVIAHIENIHLIK